MAVRCREKKPSPTVLRDRVATIDQYDFFEAPASKPAAEEIR
jgi:hypothetical protein